MALSPEILNLEIRECKIHEAKPKTLFRLTVTKKLIYASDFAYEKVVFSHDKVHLRHNHIFDSPHFLIYSCLLQEKKHHTHDVCGVTSKWVSSIMRYTRTKDHQGPSACHEEEICDQNTPCCSRVMSNFTN